MSGPELRGWATDILGDEPTDIDLLNGSALANMLERLGLAQELSTTLQHGSTRAVLSNWHRLARELKHTIGVEVDGDTIALVLAGDLPVLFTKVGRRTRRSADVHSVLIAKASIED